MALEPILSLYNSITVVRVEEAEASRAREMLGFGLLRLAPKAWLGRSGVMCWIMFGRISVYTEGWEES